MSVLEEPDLGVERAMHIVNVLSHYYCQTSNCLIMLLMLLSVNTILLSQCCTDPSKTGQLI